MFALLKDNIAVCDMQKIECHEYQNNWDSKRAYREDWTVNANSLWILYATKSTISAITSLTKLLKTLWYNPIYACF
jgi:hypothetical protein